jgi:hypothetical protein
MFTVEVKDGCFCSALPSDGEQSFDQLLLHTNWTVQLNLTFTNGWSGKQSDDQAVLETHFNKINLRIKQIRQFANSHFLFVVEVKDGCFWSYMAQMQREGDRERSSQT